MEYTTTQQNEQKFLKTAMQSFLTPRKRKPWRKLKNSALSDTMKSMFTKTPWFNTSFTETLIFVMSKALELTEPCMNSVKNCGKFNHQGGKRNTALHFSSRNAKEQIYLDLQEEAWQNDYGFTLIVGDLAPKTNHTKIPNASELGEQDAKKRNSLGP